MILQEEADVNFKITGKQTWASNWEGWSNCVLTITNIKLKGQKHVAHAHYYDCKKASYTYVYVSQ